MLIDRNSLGACVAVQRSCTACTGGGPRCDRSTCGSCGAKGACHCWQSCITLLAWQPQLQGNLQQQALLPAMLVPAQL